MEISPRAALRGARVVLAGCTADYFDITGDLASTGGGVSSWAVGAGVGWG